MKARLICALCLVACVLVCLVVPGRALAAGPLDPGVSTGVISENLTSYHKRVAAFWIDSSTVADVGECYGPEAQAALVKAASRAEAVRAAADDEDANAPMAVAPSEAQIADAARAVKTATEAFELAEAGFLALARVHAEQPTPASTTALEALEVKRDVARAARDSATNAHRALLADRDRAEARNAVIRAARDKVTDAARALARDTSFALGEEAFRAMLANDARVEVCERLQLAWLALPHTSGPRIDEKQGKAQIEEHRRDTYFADLFRKASELASGVQSGNGLVEKPGSPDRVIVALMAGLGAESKTDGGRVIATLNLASLFEPDAEARAKLPALTRHLFFQANVPVSSTEAVAPVGATPGAEGGDIVRFAFKVGGSFVDDTDTRVIANDACYRLSWIAARARFDAGDDAAGIAEQQQRRQFMNICDRMAASHQRLAWRAGISLATQEEDTDVETIAGSVVWAPASFMYISGIYQHVLVPEPINTFGGGISFGYSAGGDTDAEAWARVGAEGQVLGIHRPNEEDDLDMEARISAVIRAKLFADATTTLSIGPRILGSAPDEPELLATVALSWDADRLIDDLLRPPAASKQKKEDP